MSKIKKNSVVRFIGDNKDRHGQLAKVHWINKENKDNDDIMHLSFFDHDLYKKGSWSCRASSLELVDKEEIVYPFHKYTSAQIAKLIMDEYLDNSYSNDHSYNRNYDSAIDTTLASLFKFGRKDVQETLEVVIENNRESVHMDELLEGIMLDFHKWFRQIGVINAVHRNSEKLSLDHMVWTLLSSRQQTFFKLIRRVFEEVETFYIK